jgi:coenzyme PQQ precursor peptide PqqA
MFEADWGQMAYQNRTNRMQPHCAGGGLGLSIRQRAALRGQEDMLMAWTTPTLVEICLGLEINGYLPAEF